MSNHAARPAKWSTAGRVRASAPGQTAPLCGSPVGCARRPTHTIVDPVDGGMFGACDEHWPDFMLLLWSIGAWVSDCPCPTCTTGQPPDRSRPHSL